VSYENIRRRSGLELGVFAALCFGAAALGTATMRGRGRPDGAWFHALRKPPAQPPARVFGPVWTMLYATIAYSAWRVWKMPRSSARSRALTLWGAQLALNAAWTPLFFGARRPALALFDLLALDTAAALYAATAARIDRRAVGAFVPYLGWLGFATYLNASIVRRNR
jgi:benzodiazapine receptor